MLKQALQFGLTTVGLAAISFMMLFGSGSVFAQGTGPTLPGGTPPPTTPDDTPPPAAPGDSPTPTTPSGGGSSSAVDDVTAGVEATGDAGSGPDVQEIVRTVIEILSWVVGVVAVIMVIIGGLRYVLSGGDANNTNAAKNTILYALIGLVIVAIAQLIVRFVLKQVT